MNMILGSDVAHVAPWPYSKPRARVSKGPGSGSRVTPAHAGHNSTGSLSYKIGSRQCGFT